LQFQNFYQICFTDLPEKIQVRITAYKQEEQMETINAFFQENEICGISLTPRGVF
jgi:hypothetical protein